MNKAEAIRAMLAGKKLCWRDAPKDFFYYHFYENKFKAYTHQNEAFNFLSINDSFTNPEGLIVYKEFNPRVELPEKIKTANSDSFDSSIIKIAINNLIDYLKEKEGTQ
ncbi:hypothetical protein A2300_04010 [Candidatus Falkowbacteria bacterium RIFOXYB2_FULL_35_7]|uniref:Uncharacterized protein n=1 Tax=Candidatus Falkowbacteria bacterium RIFOXYC2_FULL_36_12 TaxID=1798002 RepID=A0A1F5T0V0_9BACT|nr:MAG: hypothetical protein A2300_04010 [Candidatus Falkowbacteria bacterium RIFOXYB2_FULL_35_7]OGF32605.1 MAG: hypothetical protein A2478_00080 [Candidatus Falkowbacteria bacterium RIFOXYC2_FULL_36_12]